MGNDLRATRVEELRRRVRSLPDEVQAWTLHAAGQEAMKPHHSQLLALEQMMTALLAPHLEQAKALTPGDPGFTSRALELIQEVARAQKVWDYFRDELALRFSPALQPQLWVADTVAWSCHRPVLEQAAASGIVNLDRVREPPLTRLIADLSPAAWARGSRPNDGQYLVLGSTYTLPIPIIEVPADHLVNCWELLSVSHEVAHVLERDLGLESALETSLAKALANAEVPADRAAWWQAWRSETFADLVALQLSGPAFVRALMHLLLLPDRYVLKLNSKDEHATPYLRILMDAEYCRTLIPDLAGKELETAAARQRVATDAERVESEWRALYPVGAAAFELFLGDIELVWKALMDTPLPELKGSSVRLLVPFTAADDVRIRAAAHYLATGQNAPGGGSIKKIRHCISAARLALESPHAPVPIPERLREVDERARSLVRDNTPDVVRGSTATPHLKHLSQLALELWGRSK